MRSACGDSPTIAPAKRTQQMDWLPAFMMDWWFLVTMFVVLVGLIILLMVLRNKGRED